MNYLEIAADYVGKPDQIAYYTDTLGEDYVVLRMMRSMDAYYLVWIGLETEPEECEICPFKGRLNWECCSC